MYSIVWCDTPKSICVDEGRVVGSLEMLDEELSEGSMRTCKGSIRCVNKLVLKHDMYKMCLMDVELRNNKVKRIGSDEHQLYTYDTRKVSLCVLLMTKGMS